MFGHERKSEAAKPAVPAAPEPKYKLKTKIADLDWEIANQPGSGNFRLYKEDGSSSPVGDVNTILLWEILKALHKA